MVAAARTCSYGLDEGRAPHPAAARAAGEDVHLLAHVFLNAFNAENGRSVKGFSADARWRHSPGTTGRATWRDAAERAREARRDHGRGPGCSRRTISTSARARRRPRHRGSRKAREQAERGALPARASCKSKATLSACRQAARHQPPDALRSDAPSQSEGVRLAMTVRFSPRRLWASPC